MWGAPQRRAFQEIKDALVTSPVLALFDPNLETVVSADASSYRAGANYIRVVRPLRARKCEQARGGGGGGWGVLPQENFYN